MLRRTCTDDDRDVALAMLEVLKGDTKKVAKDLKISGVQIKAWAAEALANGEPAPNLDNMPALPGAPGPEPITPEPDPDDAQNALTVKQTRFIDFYLTSANGNATEAARLAGYQGDANTLSSVGYENLRKPEIGSAIAARMQAATMSADEVLFRLTAQARANLADFGTLENGSFRLDLGKAAREGKAMLIKKISYTRDGDTILELYDAQSALDKIGRYHRLWDGRVPDLDGEIAQLLAALGAGGEGKAAQPSESGPGAPPEPADQPGLGGAVR